MVCESRSQALCFLWRLDILFLPHLTDPESAVTRLTDPLPFAHVDRDAVQACATEGLAGVLAAGEIERVPASRGDGLFHGFFGIVGFLFFVVGLLFGVVGFLSGLDGFLRFVVGFERFLCRYGLPIVGADGVLGGVDGGGAVVCWLGGVVVAGIALGLW